MSNIISIGTAVPQYRHAQSAILEFMQKVYAPSDAEKRKLRFLYSHGGIDTRYSVIPDYSLQANEWQFYPATENLEPFPDLEQRMNVYKQNAAALSVKAVEDCLKDIPTSSITHLVTVSCTGLSAPGLDIELVEQLGLSPSTQRVAVNFMGCYAAIQALKLAHAFCATDKDAQVLIVCTELCTIHFQKEASIDNITSSMLFSDGCAAALVNNDTKNGLSIENFFGVIAPKGIKDMAWDVSSSGFKMTLSAYVPDLIEEDFDGMVSQALEKAHLKKEAIDHWCIHPGGKKILESVHKSLGFTNGQLTDSYNVLRNYGNMSSATVLFVLKEMMPRIKSGERVLGAAFGPGLTMETFILSK